MKRIKLMIKRNKEILIYKIAIKSLIISIIIREML